MPPGVALEVVATPVEAALVVVAASNAFTAVVDKSATGLFPTRCIQLRIVRMVCLLPLVSGQAAQPAMPCTRETGELMLKLGMV